MSSGSATPADPARPEEAKARVLLSATEEQLEAELCRLSLHEFVRQFWPVIESQPFVDGWHIEQICKHLEAVTRGDIKSLVINIPPGTGKSLVVSVMWPVWTWVTNPALRYFCASYDHKLSTRDNVRSRALIESDKFQKMYGNFKIVKGQDLKTYYETDQGGWRLATSVGGHGTGQHPDCVLCDDAQNAEQAESELEREAVTRWWDLTMSSRGMVRDVRRVIVMQRLHVRDLTAHVLAKGGYEHLMLPMRFEPDRACYTCLGRADPRTEEGELLIPELFTEEIVASLEKSLGGYGAAGQLQQRPAPKGGGTFKCLVAGTKIETAHGAVPIECVREGDVVLTRLGYRRVEWSGKTGEAVELVAVLASDGTLLASTPEHLILLRTGEFVKMNSLKGEDVLVGLEGGSWLPGQPGRRISKENTSALVGAGALSLSGFTTSIGGSPDTFTATMSVPRAESTSLSTEWSTFERKGTSISTGRDLPRPFIERCGSSIGAVSPEAIISITKTRTQATIRLRILSVSHRRHTRKGIEFSRDLKLGKPIESGTSQTLVEKFIDSEPFACGRRGRPKPTSAWTAKQKSLLAGLVALERFAVEVATRSGDGGHGTPVYDLTVEDAHEFFANGVLVHNSEYFNNRVRAAPYDCTRIRYVDRAATSLGGCYSASVLMAKSNTDPPLYYVEHVFRGQWEPRERNQRIIASAHRDRAKYGSHEPVHVVEAERGSTGLESFQNLAALMAGFRIKEDIPSGSKDTRAEPFADQCAAGNVLIVEDGTWDVQAYVDELVAFRPTPGKRVGGYVDQVDASSGAFNLLAGTKRGTGIRVVTFAASRKRAFKIVVCDTEQLQELVLDHHHALLVSLSDPEPLGTQELPAHGLTRLLDSFKLRFAAIQPADYQDRWEEPVPGFGRPPADLVMTREHGKRLWTFLLRKRPDYAGVYVFHDDGVPDRALSVACAVCDGLGHRKQDTIFCAGLPSLVEKAPIPSIYEVVRASKGMVVS